MTPERARELLAAERERIERSLADLGEPVGTDELSTLDNPADQGSVLYERELEEGLLEGLRRELEALERAEARLADGTYGALGRERTSRFPTSGSRPTRWRSGRSRKNAVSSAGSESCVLGIRRAWRPFNPSEPLAAASGRSCE